jgi:glycerol-3-phosphate acyltransferase PlsY
VVILFGFVGLASVLGTIALAVTLVLTDAAPPLLAFGVLAALLVIFTHRGNIARMRAGTEPRATRLWLLGARRGAS